MPDAPSTEEPADVITSAGAASLSAARDRRARFAQLDADKRKLDADKRAILAEMADLGPQIIEDFVELGTDSIRVMVGDVRKSVYLNADLWAGPVKSGVDDYGEATATDEDWKRAVTAARAAGCGHLVQERFNGQSFSKWLREFRTEHGPGWRDALPAGFEAAISIKADTSVKVKKA